MKKELPRVLVVDDETRILNAVGRNLRGALDLSMATSGQEALALLKAAPAPFQVVVSDMKMPEMSGIALLSQIRRDYPQTVRILVTGFAELGAVVRAVNEGHIFRFLAKPCSTTDLLDAIRAGVRQYELLGAEKVLLEQTFRGSIDAMTGILSLASPTLFGRASRVKELAELICAEVGIQDRWLIQVAAQLAQIGRISLPDDTAAKLAHGDLLSGQEAAMVDRVPGVTRSVLEHIPRLEAVLEVLEYLDKNFDGTGLPADKVAGEEIPLPARVLKLAGRIEELQTRGYSVRRILDTLKVESHAYDPALLHAYEAIAEVAADVTGPRGIGMNELRIGMVMIEAVRSRSGVLLIAPGQHVTESLLTRIHNYNATVGVEVPLWIKPIQVDDEEAAASAVVPELSC